MTTRLPPRRSLSWRAVATVIAVEVVFALILGVTMGAFTALNVARERHQAIHQISAVVAAAMMPVVADQQEPQVKAQMASILSAAQFEDVDYIRIVDSSGAQIASNDESGAPLPAKHHEAFSPLSMLLDEQIVERPITVDGLEIARAYVAFAPPGLAESVRGSVLAALLVLVSVVLVSAPWTAWVLIRDIIEPLDELGRYASSIADGRTDIEAPAGAPGEVGELQEALGRMAAQLKQRDVELRSAWVDLSKAYLELENAKREIEQLAKLKADFVAVAAHEIRSPLATIALYVELLETGVYSELEPETLEAVEAIGSASSRLGSVVSDLMDSALLERGLMPIEFGEVWVAELLEGAVKDARVVAQSHEIEIRLEDRTADTVIRGDALRLRQVLDNLLSNALKYSPEGTKVDVRTRAEGEFVEIEVADQGRGVSEDDQHVLFTLFGRVDSGDGRDTAGLGLGLAISARIVQAHGGRLTFRENEAGEGSVFCLRLPKGGPPSDVSRTTITAVGDDRT